MDKLKKNDNTTREIQWINSRKKIIQRINSIKKNRNTMDDPDWLRFTMLQDLQPLTLTRPFWALGWPWLETQHKLRNLRCCKTSNAFSTLLRTGTGLALQQTPQLSARPPQLEAHRLSFRHEHDVQHFHNRVASSFSSRDTGDAILSVRNQNCQLATVCSYLSSLCACTFVERSPLWMPLLSAFEQSSSPWWF